jgi:hypothetical protein
VRVACSGSLVVWDDRSAGRLLTRGVALGEPGGLIERCGGVGEERRQRGREAFSGSLAFAGALVIRPCQLERGGEAGAERRRVGGQLVGVLTQGAGAGAELLGGGSDRTRMGSQALR